MGIEDFTCESRSEQNCYLAISQRETGSILSPSSRRRVAFVSPDSFKHAIQSLEDSEAIRAAIPGRLDDAGVSHEELKAEFGL